MPVSKADIAQVVISAVLHSLCDGSEDDRIELTDAGLKALFNTLGTELATDETEQDILMYTRLVDWEGDEAVN